MNKTAVTDALRALQADDSKRRQTARLADVLDEVEATLAKGVKRASVVAALNQHGFNLTLRQFDNALYRLRKKRQQKTVSGAE